MSKDIEKILDLEYEQACKFLQNKYGLPSKNYFSTEECKSKVPKNGRGYDGLFLHHIDEDKAIMLSNSEYAKRNPFEYQKKD